MGKRVTYSKDDNNPLFTEVVPEIIKNKIFELAALGYSHTMVAIAIADMFEPFFATPAQVDQFMGFNRNRIIAAKKKLRDSRIPSREELAHKITKLLTIRFRRAIHDFQEYEEISQKYRDNEIDYKEYQRRAKTLYLPTSVELLNLMNTLDKKIIAPPPKRGKAAKEESSSDEEAKLTPSEQIDPERRRQIEEAIANNDMIKLQELTFAGQKE